LHSDVLIVGAGSAGSVLAEQLSGDSNCRVTVVESGPGPADPEVRAHITNGLRLPIGAASPVVRHYETTLTDHPPRRSQIPRGAVVGGSGAVNGGYFCRGLPSDFDGWGLPGWAWPDVLDHFRMIETDLDFHGPLHGTAGPILVRRVSQMAESTARFVRSAVGIGFREVADLNAGTPGQPLPPGVGPVPLNIDGATRLGPGGAFLEPALGRANLTLLTHTRVGRIRIRAGRAFGLECIGPDGAADLTADRIVLSAGAIGSAHLLMVSGIGAPDELRAAGVRVLADLPVGSRFADHPEWVLPVGWPAAPGRPVLEAVLVTPDGLEIRPYTTGFESMTGARSGGPADRPHIAVALMRPHSRGRISLASADPRVPPLISHRYDSEPTDVAALRAGAELARELAGPATEVGAPSWSTSQHLCGTAPMGADGDEDAVLDPQCRVRGIDGLWVVDGSILPAITGRGPHATIVMAGHRAAEFVCR
jgi:choline dehydrogenase